MLSLPKCYVFSVAEACRPDPPSPTGINFVFFFLNLASLNTQLLLKQVVWPIRGHFGTVFGLRIKANTGYSASLCFLGCPMRPTSSWVIERSSQYLIYLVIISNSQPYNKFLHIEKKQKKNFFFLYIYSNIANEYNSRKC